jgi:hypothetical protein
MKTRQTFISLASVGFFLTSCQSAQHQQPSPTGLPEPPAPATSTRAPPSAELAPVASNAPAAASPGTASRTFNFDSDRGDAAPAGFSFGRTGGGAVGRWIVRSESDAPSKPNVLAQVNPDQTDYRFPVAVAEGVSFGDLRLAVRCKPISGQVDQACGLVFRYRDENNYYITRANALENNVRLYHVVKGNRQQFAGWSGKVTSGTWHALRVDAKGDHFEVYWDEKKVIDAHDSTFTEAGKVGVWTKADSVTYFDDLSVSPVQQFWKELRTQDTRTSP